MTVMVDDGTRIAPHGDALLDLCRNPEGGGAPNDDAVAALLQAEAAKRGARVVCEHVEGYWRAGFVVPDELGEMVIELSTAAPDRETALRSLAERAAGSDGAHHGGVFVRAVRARRRLRIQAPSVRVHRPR